MVASLGPLVRGASVRSLCRHTPRPLLQRVQWPQFSPGAAFRPTIVACQPRQQYPSPPDPPPPHPLSRKPEDLYPESFPLDEKDLVNPSGRIYSVRRPPDEDGRDPLEHAGPFALPLEATTPPRIFRPILFFAIGGSIVYLAAAKYSLKQNEDVAEMVGAGEGGTGIFGDFSSFFFGGSRGAAGETKWEGVSEQKIRAAFKHQVAERMGLRMNWLMGWCDQLHLPSSARQFVGRMYLWGAESYLGLTRYKEALVPVIAVNTAVFISWRLSMIPALRTSLQRFMIRSFLHTPASGRTYTLLTSCFSHRGGLHFLFNNVAMWSFGAAVLSCPAFYYSSQSLSNHTPEASITPHFLAFFATAGVFSALVSHLSTALRFRFVAWRHGMSMAKLAVGRIGGLGSSGAVYALVVAHALAFPDNHLALIFLPMVHLPIGTGVALMVGFDAVALLLRLQIFDHTAHLGGAAFGWLYFHYGNEVWEMCKARIRESSRKAQEEGAR